MSINILFAGFGGQGVLFAGKVAAYSGILEEKQVSWFPSYGPEMRGGTANCSVCLSEEPIGSPMVDQPDLLIAMNGPSYDKFAESVVPGGTIIADSNLVTEYGSHDGVEQHKIPATQLAEDNGLKGLGNMICLGYALKKVPFTQPDVLKEGIEQTVSAARAHLVDKNKQAFLIGYEYEEPQ